MDTPFLPAEEEQPSSGELRLIQEDFYDPRMMILCESETFTCSCRSSDSVDVDLGESGGVVVDYNLDCWNIQTSEAA